jgi:hypothetical protein
MELLANPTLSQKLGVGGRVTAEQYSIAHIAERWEEIYNSAIIKART